MAGEYTSVADGLVLVMTLAFWSYAIDWLSYQWDFFGRLVHPQPRQIVRDGVPLKRAMRQELITMEELMTHVRESGTETLDRVRGAWVEGNGEISIVLKDGDAQSNQDRPTI